MPESRIERERQKALSRGYSIASIPSPLMASVALLLTTTTVHGYPTTAAAFFASNPTEIDGSEIEGGAAAYTADATQVVYAINVGAVIPPIGTRVVANSIGGRWVFRYDG